MGTKHRKIEIGQTYGRLTVREYLGLIPYNGTNRNRHMYRCECSCGNFIDLPGTYIGKAWKSCGCLQKESREKPIPAGTRFGRLTVIEPHDLIPGRGYRYKCQCDCGNIIISRGDMLRRGEVQSCGCLHDELFREHAKIAYKNSFVDGTNVPRIASTQTIQRNNTSGVTGVTWHKGTGKWRASISFKGKSYSLGYYTEIPLAAKARKAAEDELFGNFLKWYQETYPDQWKRIQSRQQKKHPQ